MIDFEILSTFGTSDATLKAIFTAVDLSDDQKATRTTDELQEHSKQLKTRKFFEERIRNRMQEGITRSMKTYKRYAAADIAWDGAPIHQDMMPLLAYAQGNMDKVELTKEFIGLGDEKRYVDDENGQKTLNLPKFVQVHANLVRHFITRRLASQSNKYTNLTPFYAYDSRSTDQVGKLRADAVSQRMDIMADEYGHRQHDSQCMRDTFLYSKCVDFVTSAWEQDKHWRRKDPTGKAEKPNMEEYIEREGVSWFNPHPSRLIYDDAHPLSSLNTDNGCTYVGYWDIVRFGAISDSGTYWNKGSVRHSTYLWDIFNSNASFFSKYYGTIKPPETLKSNEKDPAGGNDIKNNMGQLAQMTEDSPSLQMVYFEKIVPAEHNIGSYPYPVWVRFITAGDNTIIHAELMPSRPAAFMTFNDSDGRSDNISFAHELMPYQDAMNNLLNAMQSIIEMDCAKQIMIDKDALDASTREQFIQKMRGQDWAGSPTVVEVSFSKLRDLGINIKDVIHTNGTTGSQQTIESILRAIAQLVALVEKLIAMSPAELGQPAPREISATEVHEISQTTSTVASFISDGIDAYREAKKRIQYEGLIACGTQPLNVPVVHRYTTAVIEKAGFQVADGIEEADNGKQTIVGTVKKLRHTMVFSSRDGSERPQNVKASQSLVQLLQVVAPDPDLRKEIGKERMFLIINEIFRLSGAKIDLKLEAGESQNFGIPQDKIEELLKQNLTANEQNTTDIDRLLGQAGADPREFRDNAAQLQGAGLTVVEG